MIRSATRFFLFCVSAVLLTGFFLPAVRADGPTLTAKFGITGRYRPGGWCLVRVGVQNPGSEPISGQLQVLSADTGRSQYGRQSRQNVPSVVYACPVSIPGTSAGPQTFPIYLRGIDPGAADLTVQLVEGRERGDGRVLAAINNQNQNTSQAFTGGPIGTNDQLEVGFGGDPGAFMFLNSRRLALPLTAPPAINAYSQNGNNAGMPATVQIAEAATAVDLPDKAVGYDGVSSFLLRSDAPIEGMTEAQANALKGWVAAGGHLIVCGGSDPTRFGSAFFDGLLPASLAASGGSGIAILTPKPLPGVRVLQAGGQGKPQIISGPYGAGTVTMTAFDPTGSAYQSAGNFALSPVWQTLLSGQAATTSSVLGMTAAREENYNAVYYGSSPPLLSEAVMRGPSLDAPGTSVIAIFLLVYLIVLVPVNYLVLKRFDRKELAWVTIPALVFLFAAGTFGVGYAAKGGSVFVNRAALIETGAGQQEAGVYSELGLFSPHRTNYDIGLTGDNLVAAIPNPGVYYGGQSGDDSQFSGPAQFVETASGVSLVNTPVNMWAMRAFDAQSTVDLGGTIDGAFADKNGQLTGNLINHITSPLTDCQVLYNGNWLKVGTLAPGVTLSLPSGIGSVSQSVFQANGQRLNSQSNIHDRMHAALGDYFQSLMQPQNNSNYYGSPPPAYTPVSGEALLAGWSSDPKLAGPSPQVDGHSVTENDVTLVIIHLPVSGAPTPLPVPPPVAVQSAFPPPSGLPTYQFATIAKSSHAYRQAQNTQTFPVTPPAKSVGRVVCLRGIVSTFVQRSGVRGALLDFVPDVSQQGVTALLPFSFGRRDPAVLGLLGREVVVTGVLTRANGKAQILVSQASQLQVVR